MSYNAKENLEKIENEVENIIGYKFIPESYKDKEFVELLGFLKKKGKLTKDHVQIVLAEYSVSREPIGIILVRNGFISHRDYIESIIEYNPDAIINEETISDVIDHEFLINTGTMVIAETKDRIYLSTLSNESFVRVKIQEYHRDKEVEFLPASIEKIDSYLVKIRHMAYGESNFLEQILKDALRKGASDIHIIPKNESYSIFFRTLGVKNIMHEGDIEEYYTLMARIKDRSRMDLAEKRIPQDGGFQIEHNGKLIDMRVATIPLVNTNEQIVIRLLDPDRVQPSLDLLGITNISEWRKGVSRPDGIALICGPTGSGKTTTLQASIREMNRFERAIYTVEDPVEYRIPFVAQVNINNTVGLTFPNALRAFMRADPDIMMVGEIRDEDTARIAIKGAETGHLVVGTLHTSSIRSTIDRLRDIGVSYKEMRYILRTVLVQRLVRTLCQTCDGSGYDEHDNQVCSECNGQGYAGRTVVSECKYFADERDVDKMIEGNIDWPIMVEDAVHKVEIGVTDAKEIIRVFGEEGERVLKEKGLMTESNLYE